MIWDHKTKGHINAIQCGESKDKKLRTEYEREEKCLPWPSDFITQKKAVKSRKSLQSTVKLQVKANTKKALAGIHQSGISPLSPCWGYTDQHRSLLSCTSTAPPSLSELPLADTLGLALLPVYIPGHSKVSNFSHSPRPSTGKEAVPGSNIPTRKGKKSNRKRRTT